MPSVEPTAPDHKRSPKRSDHEERKTAREAQQFDDLPMPMTASAEPTEQPKKFGFGFVPHRCRTHQHNMLAWQ